MTTGLIYGDYYIPEIGNIYSANTMIKISSLFDDIINRFPGGKALFAIDANIGINDLVAGTTPTLVGSGEVLQNGEFCFDNTRAFDYVIGKSMSDLKEFTIEMDYTITSDATGYLGFFGNKRSWSTMCVCMQWGRSGYRPAMFWNDYFDTTTGGAEHSEWVNDGVYHHVAMVKKGEIVTLYSDGKAIAKYESATKNLNLAIENLLAVGTQHVENQIFPGRMKHFRVIGEAIYDGDFDLPEWVGKGNGNSGPGSGDNGDTPEEETHEYVYTLYGATNPNVNGNYWDVRDQFQTFYDADGNPVDSFENATYMFDGIWTNGRCYMAFNGTFTQITEGTPLTQERIYTFENVYPNDLILSEYTEGLIITNYGEPIAIKVSGVPESNAAYNGVYLYYPDDVAHDTPGAQVFKHTENEDRYLFLYDGKWLLQIDYNWNHGVYKSSRLISSAWFDGGMIGLETVISGMKSELTSVPVEKVYKYTVSGAGTPGVDGNYYDTGETTKGPFGDDLGYHIYTNDTAKIEFMTDYNEWSISLDGSQKYYIVWDDEAMTTGTTVTVFGEDPAPTISVFVHGGGGSTNEPTNPDSGDDTLSEEEKIETLMSQQTIAENSVTSIANDANVITEKLNDITLLSETLTEIIG